MMNILKTENLSVTADNGCSTLVDNVNISIPQNGSLILIGQSGSGKTMLCRCIMNLWDKKLNVEGKIFFNGKELISMNEKEHRKLCGRQIALIPQNPMTAFDPSQKMGKQLVETVRLHMKVSKSEAEKLVAEALSKTGLSDTEKVMLSYPYMLSGGMLQRCAISVVLVLKPSLVLADEPTTALDAEHRMAVTELLRDLRDEGTAVLFVTHDFVSAEIFGGNAAVMKSGRIIEENEVKELFTHPSSEYTRLLAEAALI